MKRYVNLRLVVSYQESMVFEETLDTEEGGYRLTIVCHDGFRDSIFINGFDVSALGISIRLGGWVTDLSKLRTIRVVACKSGNDWLAVTEGQARPNFAQRYFGCLLANGPQRWGSEIESFGRQLSRRLLAMGRPGVVVKCYVGAIGSTCSEDLIWSKCMSASRSVAEGILMRHFRIVKDGVGTNYNCLTYHDGKFVRQDILGRDGVMQTLRLSR